MLNIENLEAIIKVHKAEKNKFKDKKKSVKSSNLSEYKVLKGINLKINPGEIHIIMGPNGSGKSSLASLLAGHPKYICTGGKISFENENLLEMEPEERAQKGIFLAFQYPIEIPGINNSYFIKTALNNKNEILEKNKISPKDFLTLIEENRKSINLDKKLLKRHVNCGFSGGEKKRNEILQMAMLKPKLAILDEIDSGLDVDALKDIGENIQRLQTKENSTILITHYARILKYINPDKVHILVDGKIIKSGDTTLAQQIEKEGYLSNASINN
ncbi:MAG: Fe-S cluster assembly ATPase SufC [Bacteroidetes bacterium]|nr:Fe-S cluster assembly ATPase SufC [Bacteroidota bacterium]